MGCGWLTVSLAYYNEFDPFCADWLLELIADGLIAPGIVDRRSIVDVLPSDLKGFNQCHFFAGIGVWSLSLRLAGFPDDRPIWTGSAPCQPFSAAGKAAGFDDERHLWPAWFHLIECAKPANVPLIGEQVASKDGRTWFDLVSGDMEGLGHACGALDTCAAGFGAPFIGQRLYWLAAPADPLASAASGRGTTQDERIAERGENVGMGATDDQYERSARSQQTWPNGAVRPSEADRMGQASSATSERNTRAVHSAENPFDGARVAVDGVEPERYTDAGRDGGVAASDSAGRQPEPNRQPAGNVEAGSATTSIGKQSGGDCASMVDSRDGERPSGIPLHPVDYWRDAEWLLCRDPNGPRFRPVESASLPVAYDRALGRIVAESSGARQTHFPLTEKNTYVNRLNEIRGAGNALNVAQASTFIECVMEYLTE